MKNEYAQWRKLDNAALAFPAVTGKNDTRVFRFYCELKEEIKEENLQAALERTMEKYPLFRAVLRKGLFWFYLERRDIPAVVKKEAGAPCSGLYIPDKKTLLFRVSYYKNRINFEVFHALTDGTGAMHFLMELVKNYLQETHHPGQSFRSFFRMKTLQAGIWRRTAFPVLFFRCTEETGVQEACISAERREAQAGRYEYHGSLYSGKRDPFQGKSVRRVHHCFSHSSSYMGNP